MRDLHEFPGAPSVLRAPQAVGCGTGIDDVGLARMDVHRQNLQGAARGVGDLFGDRYVQNLLPGLSTVPRPVNPALTVPGRRGGGEVDRSRFLGHEGKAFLPAQVE